MKIPRVYPDTSVLGGCFDREFEIWSRALMEDYRAGRILPVLSELLEAELVEAPGRVRAIFTELISLSPEILPITTEALDLAEHYASRGIVSARFRNDMLHIALATVADSDIVVSWNFRHIVRFDKIQAFNAVNMESGYKAVAIHSPREVATYASETE